MNTISEKTKKYNNENYKQVTFYIKKSDYKIYELKAQEKKLKTNKYIRNLINNNNLTSEEQYVINAIRYLTEKDKQEIIEKVSEINNKYTPEEKTILFNSKKNL